MKSKNNSRLFYTVIFASVAFTLTLLLGIFTDVNAQAFVFGREKVPLKGTSYAPIHYEDRAKIGEWTYCQYDMPIEGIFDVDLLDVSLPETIEPGEIFTVDMLYRNTGDIRLFSNGAGCDEHPVFNVGTQTPSDRASRFGVKERAISGWVSPGRIEMQEDFADPDTEFHVVFQSIAPEGDDIYREFFQPVVEGVQWLEEPFVLDFEVGNPTDEMRDNIKFVSQVAIAASDLTGLERNLEIDLATQTMYAKYGDMRVWKMQISSGAWDTPTPRGNYKVLNKQELRIGGQPPHYRMPYWLGWRADGYGIHALPYLGSNDSSGFWSEALDHIGIPVSHGCIRTLPEDARTLYQFADIGTPLEVH